MANEPAGLYAKTGRSVILDRVDEFIIEQSMRVPEGRTASRHC